MLKLSDNPPIRSPEIASVEQAGGDWWVALTKARNEKSLAWDLQALGIAYFLPMVPVTRFSGGRRRRLMMPLFSSYLFFAGTAADRLSAFRTDRIASTIAVTNRQRFVEELRTIELALESNLAINAFPFAVVGRRVRVREGPLAGVVGTVSRRDNIDYLQIEIHLLGQGVQIQIEPGLLEPWE
jgi:Transcription termination factor nusG